MHLVQEMRFKRFVVSRARIINCFGRPRGFYLMTNYRLSMKVSRSLMIPTHDF